MNALEVVYVCLKNKYQHFLYQSTQITYINFQVYDLKISQGNFVVKPLHYSGN